MNAISFVYYHAVALAYTRKRGRSTATTAATKDSPTVPRFNKILGIYLPRILTLLV